MQITDTKATGRKITLLHYVIEMLEKNDPSVRELPAEFADVSKAAICIFVIMFILECLPYFQYSVASNSLLRYCICNKGRCWCSKRTWLWWWGKCYIQGSICHIFVFYSLFLFFGTISLWSLTSRYKFAVSAKVEVEHVIQITKDTEAALKKVFVHYGDDPKKVEKPNDVEDFLKLIVAFVHHFEVIKSI